MSLLSVLTLYRLNGCPDRDTPRPGPGQRLRRSAVVKVANRLHNPSFEEGSELMADSILDTITQSIPPSLASRFSSSYGESQSAVTKAFGVAIPAILGMITNRAANPGFMSQICALAKDPANDAALIDDPDRLADRVGSPTGDSGLIDRFRSLIFGANQNSLQGAIASYAGVQSSTASSILTAALPLVLGYLGKMVRRDGLDPAGLGRRLAAENQSVLSELPASFSRLITGGAPAREEEYVADEEAPTYKRSSTWPWVTAVIALAAVWGLVAFVSRHRMTEEAERAVGTAGEYATLVLPSGVSLRVPSAGAEARLLAYVAGGAPLGADTWIDFDRLTFETDSATLTPDSREQLSRIAAILKAYPSVHLKIGGYTDNVGDPAANLKLSQDRAMSVMNELVRMDIDPDRLESEGYGEQYPVATNATEEGRAQNRRVAFQITAH
jgi:outer membrane protein OmpA-like peptidoglycan-associated protein